MQIVHHPRGVAAVGIITAAGADLFFKGASVSRRVLIRRWRRCLRKHPSAGETQENEAEKQRSKRASHRFTPLLDRWLSGCVPGTKRDKVSVVLIPSQ